MVVGDGVCDVGVDGNWSFGVVSVLACVVCAVVVCMSFVIVVGDLAEVTGLSVDWRQNTPSKPLRHEQEKDPPMTLHVPPLPQGLGTQRLGMFDAAVECGFKGEECL